MNELFGLLLTATLETLYMVGVAALFCAAGGLALGILLVVTAPRGVLRAPLAYRTLTALTNLGRSIPFIIIVVAIVPFTRLIVGTSIGTDAAIVPLVVGAIPLRRAPRRKRFD
jgi:D-methionine transport system permease protein